MYKIALIVCYYGQFPDYFDIWFRSCELNSEIDFIIVTDINVAKRAKNIKVIKLSIDELREKISDVVGIKVALKSPYKLCDYKPFYGEVLKEYLKDYDFWGHCDIDVIWGKLSSFITNDILKNYDLIGIYGHLMLYRNIDYMNKLFSKKGGQFSYKQVCKNPENYSFDEMSGMDLIAYKNNIKHYKSLKIANMSPDYNRFKIAGQKSQVEMFIWNEGRILRIYEENKILFEEYAYIHFSGKRPSNFATDKGLNKASLYLLSDIIEDRENIKPNIEELKKYNRFIDIKNDREQLKDKHVKKIKNIIKKTFKEKIIWIRVHIGILKFNKILRLTK